MQELKQEIESAKSILSKLEIDYSKFELGNKTAGTRVRKYAQEIKVTMQDIRVLVQKIKELS